MEENLKEKLFNKRENGWDTVDTRKKEAIFSFTKDYMNYLNKAKTEREFIVEAVKMAKENGYEDINEFEELKAGDKVFFVNRGKSMYLAVIGTENIENGLHIIGSHVDSPRLDLKPNPLCEDTELAYFKTHYYGGIKKYQWTTIPLSLHGVIVKTNGEKITVNIGEDENDPIFTITDLLPHLAQEQMEKKLKNGIDGEDLRVLIGSIPYDDKEAKEKVKLNILNILNQKYGITESDLSSSEIEVIPAFKARSLGFDSSMVAAYGQDDKVCAYSSLAAMMTLENVKNTAVCILSDKEEIGSMGNTGMESHMFDFFISEILNKLKIKYSYNLDNITDVEIKNTDIDKSYIEDKFSRLDVKAVTSKNEIINIEIQLKNEYNMIQRSLYYWSKLYEEQLEEGDRYDKLCRTVCINILDFKYLKNDRFHNGYRLKEIETNE